MSKQDETFFTSIGCMDGRCQEAVLRFGQERFGAKFADTITEAGLVGQLSKEYSSDKLLESLKQKAVISLEKHHSRGIIVHGHQECAGNPVADNIQRDDIRRSVEKIKSFSPAVPVFGVFVKRAGWEWVVEEVLS